MKISLYFLILLGLITSCQEKDPAPEVKLPPTGCDGDLTGTDCQQFFIPAGEALSYPTGTKIMAADGIEINGDIVIDPSAGGDFTLTALSGDIVIAGKITVKDTASDDPSGGRYKNGKCTSRLKNGKAADGFTLTLDARGANGNIILKKGAALFSGRGQDAPNETLTAVSGYYEGAGGGNGGLIILNAPNGKVKLPNVGNTVTPFQDEAFVLGNGGRGAGIILEANLETGSLDVVEVRGGLGGNAGQLIIDALEIEGVPSLEAMETHPGFIFDGEGGYGGYVIWDDAGKDKKYTLQEIILHGGDAGQGVTFGGNGGLAYFSSATETFIEIGNPVPNVFCYGGHGGDVFASPLPLKEVWGGNGGEYVANGVSGWDGGEDKSSNLIRDGADGGNALGQGGNGGNILAGVRAYQAEGGSGGNCDEARNYLPNYFGIAELGFLSSALGVTAGDGGTGYSDCEGCRGGSGGNAGTATAIGGKGGDVLGEAIQSFGGAGGDTWAIIRGTPGFGGNGNPAGEAGIQPPGTFLSETPGEEGNGTTAGQHGETLGFDLYPDIHNALDGETCGETLECEEDTLPAYASCTGGGASTSYYYKRKTLGGEEYIYQCEVSVLERDPVTNNPRRYQYGWSEKHTYQLAKIINGVQVIYDTTVTKGETLVQVIQFTGLPGPKGHIITSLTRNPQCDEFGNLQWPGDGLFTREYYDGDIIEEWQLSGCVDFWRENHEIDRSKTQCCLRSPSAPYPYLPCYKP